MPYMFLQYKGWEQKPFVKPFRKPFYCLFSKSGKALNLSLNVTKKKESDIFNIKKQNLSINLLNGVVLLLVLFLTCHSIAKTRQPLKNNITNGIDRNLVIYLLLADSCSITMYPELVNSE